MGAKIQCISDNLCPTYKEIRYLCYTFKKTLYMCIQNSNKENKKMEDLVHLSLLRMLH